MGRLPLFQCARCACSGKTPSKQRDSPARNRFVSISRYLGVTSGWSETMKPYILGALAVWFLMGFTGAILLGQQRIDAPTIVSGPVALWDGINSERLIGGQ